MSKWSRPLLLQFFTISFSHPFPRIFFWIMKHSTVINYYIKLDSGTERVVPEFKPPWGVNGSVWRDIEAARQGGWSRSLFLDLPQKVQLHLSF